MNAAEEKLRKLLRRALTRPGRNAEAPDGRAQEEEKRLETAVQFVKFCAVGVTNTAVSYAVNVAVLKLLEPLALSWDYVAANTAAFVLSVLWSFYWNNRFVFREGGEKRSVWRTLLKTYVTYGFTGLVLNNLLSWLWIDAVGLSKYLAPLLNLAVSIPVNFLLNKYWAYREK